ncbi:hypothetical protein AAFF_G00352280 [Aldrovandia affinis]|uniref:Uncharacterized protein n=1 Tax=Aldrovandia affinis TaxID=143900 RepID=A0AAD7SIW3_9TELE|nr:hypothetical protein AAFF_G00352280 [Aldrovandia affinis]
MIASPAVSRPILSAGAAEHMTHGGERERASPALAAWMSPQRWGEDGTRGRKSTLTKSTVIAPDVVKRCVVVREKQRKQRQRRSADRPCCTSVRTLLRAGKSPFNSEEIRSASKPGPRPRPAAEVRHSRSEKEVVSLTRGLARPNKRGRSRDTIPRVQAHGQALPSPAGAGPRLITRPPSGGSGDSRPLRPRSHSDPPTPLQKTPLLNPLLTGATLSAIHSAPPAEEQRKSLLKRGRRKKGLLSPRSTASHNACLTGCAPLPSARTASLGQRAKEEGLTLRRPHTQTRALQRANARGHRCANEECVKVPASRDDETRGAR